MIKKYGYLFTLLLVINSASYGFLKPFQRIGALAATKCFKQVHSHFTAQAKTLEYKCANNPIPGIDGTINCDGKIINLPNSSFRSISASNGIVRVTVPDEKPLNPINLTVKKPFTLDISSNVTGNITVSTHDSDQFIINGTVVSLDPKAFKRMGYTAKQGLFNNTIFVSAYDNSRSYWLDQGVQAIQSSNYMSVDILVPIACSQFVIKAENTSIQLKTPGTDASLNITTSHGNISAENIYGKTICSNNHGPISLQNMHNEVIAQTSDAPISCTWKEFPQSKTNNVLITHHAPITINAPAQDIALEASTTSHAPITFNNKNYGTYFSHSFGSGKHSIKAHTNLQHRYKHF